MQQNDLEMNHPAPSTTPNLETLVREHRNLDQRVADLSEKSFLSPAQTLELTRLKKEKLKIKDRIAGLAQVRVSA